MKELDNKIILDVKEGSDITQILQKGIINTISNPCIIVIPAGNYVISSEIKLIDNIHIIGAKNHSTKLFFSDATNTNMFVNFGERKGNQNIRIENLCLDGNAAKQFRPKDVKKLSFCNIFYFMKSKKIKLLNIKAINCKQTAMHFNNCTDVTIDNLQAIEMGWSGVSTSGTDDIKVSNAYIYDTGKDIMHSAVHFDGGVGTYFEGKIEKCTGNGVMLDSKFSALDKSVVIVESKSCKRGVSLSGAHENQLENVLIQNTDIQDCEVGIMVSNSRQVFIANCRVSNSSEYGLLLQGKNGGCDTVVVNSDFMQNNQDIAEIHSSKNNYFVKNNINFISKQQKIKKPIKLTKKNYQDKYTGICSVCGNKSEFIYYEKSVRESYRCDFCDASLRHRGQAKAIVDAFSWAKMGSIKELSKQHFFQSLKIYEPGIIGPLRKYLKGFPYYLQSYFWEDIPLGDFREGIQNQNLEKLTLEDNSINLIITADIFEHIRKPWMAFKEIHRVLKQGGKHIFTVPTQFPLPAKTVYRVDTSTEEDIDILPKHYHIAGDGGKSLVYTEFGADMLERLNAMGLKTEYVFIDETNELRKKNITFISTKI